LYNRIATLKTFLGRQKKDNLPWSPKKKIYEDNFYLDLMMKRYKLGPYRAIAVETAPKLAGNEVKIGNMIGAGSFGSCFEAYTKDQGICVAKAFSKVVYYENISLCANVGILSLTI
jgi:hypothetical protein